MSSNSLSTDPADLFAQLYDAAEPFDVEAARRWDFDRGLRKLTARVEEQVVATGEAAGPLFTYLLGDEGSGHFAILRGLDRALSYVNPFSGRFDPGNMYRIAIRVARRARLNTDAVPGALLFNCAFAGRPLGIPAKSQFFELVRVPAASWESVQHAWLDSVLDAPIKRVEEPRDLRIAVGCAPMVETYDELEMETRECSGQRRYRIRPRPEALRERVERVLRALDASGAVVGLLPEATLSDELLQEWRAVLKQHRKVPTNLRWIVVGTGPVGDVEPPYNRAIVLDRLTGQTLIEYDKQADFSLTASQVQTWALTPYLGSGEAAEDITRGDVVQLRECNVGRVAMLICEDLGRTMEIGPRLRDCGVSHVFAPIFSPPFTGQYGWVEGPARDYVFQVGAWVVVANSLAVCSAMANDAEATDDMKRAAAEAPTCYAIGPRAKRRNDWRVPPAQAKRSAGPEAVELVYVDGGMARRYDDFS